MLSKRRIWNCNFVLILLVLQTAVMYIEPYDFKCPSQSSWRLWAQVKCKRTMKYFCLYNNVEGKYVEGCEGPDWDRKGNKRIYAGDFSRAKCAHTRFQPFLFWSNGSMTDCVYEKSLCSEAGQIVHRENSTKDDRSCRCDFKQKYEFIKTPNNACFCIPTEEDCSCYYKANSTYSPVSAGIACTKSGINENQNRTDVILCDKSLIGKTEKERIPLKPATSNFKWKYKIDKTILVFFCFMTIFVTGGFFTALLFDKWTNEKLKTFDKYFRKNNTAGKEQLDDEEHQLIRNNEKNFLRIVHVLVRVACPVVRMMFNKEIQPDQLRKTLDKNKLEMVTRYRKQDKVINDFQWSLLFGPDKVTRQTVTSEDFDIRLMTYLLSSLADIEVGDLYPAYSDRSIGAMISRIQFINNETLRNFEGQLSGYVYSKSWDDLGQAVLQLVSSLTLDMRNDQAKTQLIGRLLVLNPINIDTKLLRLFIYLSERCPGIILQQLIFEYCELKSTTIKDLLKTEKHQLFHKRIKNEPCCICHKVSTENGVISEKQWEALYGENEDHCSHSCLSRLKPCMERVAPKFITERDLSWSKALILNIPDILNYMIDRLDIKECSQFLLHNQHMIYHSMEWKMCCKCSNVPTKKIIINIEEWNTLFKKEDNLSCTNKSKNCCCQYSVRNGIEFKDIGDICLSKIFKIAGPIGVLNNIEEGAFSYFLNWTVNEKPLRKALTDLLNMIKDKMFYVSIESSIPPQSEETTSKQLDRWIARHLQKQEATAKHPLHILIHDEDLLIVRSVMMPKDFSPCQRIKKFTDLTVEENKYLVVVHGLKKIVHPFIKKEFNTQCPDRVLREICSSIYKSQMVSSRRKVGGKNRQERIQLTPDHQRQLLSQIREKSDNLDLELMIYILKKRSNSEWNKFYIDQLDAIEHIRREIVQSSSGTLTEERFHDILHCLIKAFFHLGGEIFIEELIQLNHIKNILE